MMDEIFDQNDEPKKVNIWHQINANLDRVFPSSKELATILSAALPEQKKVEGVYTKNYLPYHVRDAKWLAEFVARVCYQLRSEANQDRIAKGLSVNEFQALDLDEIERFVTKSYKFNTARNQFEGRIIREVMKTETMKAEDTNPVQVRTNVLNTVSNEFAIDAFTAGVEMERNNSWRIYLYNRAFEKYLKTHFGVSMPTLEETNLICAKNPNLFADYMMAKELATNVYQNFSERKYFDTCSGARDCAYEAEGTSFEEMHYHTDRFQVMTDVEKVAAKKRIEEVCHKFAKQIEVCRKWLEKNQGKEQGN